MDSELALSKGLLAASLAFACIAGCKCDRSSETHETQTPQTLEAYCKVEPCQRYEDALAKLERLAPPGNACSTAETGSCGPFRYVRYSDGYWGYTQYFGASGPMVGAQTWSDISAKEDLGAVPSCTPVAERQLCGKFYAQRLSDLRADGPSGPLVGRVHPGALVRAAWAEEDAGDPAWVRVEDVGLFADGKPIRVYVERSALDARRVELVPPPSEPGSVLRATFGIPTAVWYGREPARAKSVLLRRCHEVWLRDQGATAVQNLEGVEIVGTQENEVAWNGSPSIHMSLVCPAHAVVRRGAELTVVEPNPRWAVGDAPGSDVRTRAVPALPEGYRLVEPPVPDPLALAIERGATLHWLIATDEGAVCDTWKFERVRAKPDAGGAAVVKTLLVHPGRLKGFGESGFWHPAEYRPSTGKKPAELHLDTVRSSRATMKSPCDYHYRILAGGGDELYALARPLPNDAVAFDPTEAERWFFSKKACEAHRDHAIRAIERDGRTTTRLGFHATELP